MLGETPLCGVASVSLCGAVLRRAALRAAVRHCVPLRLLGLSARLSVCLSVVRLSARLPVCFWVSSVVAAGRV